MPTPLPADTIPHIGDADMVLTNKTVITADILDACPQIRYIGVLATGYNVVDLPAGRGTRDCGDQHPRLLHPLGRAVYLRTAAGAMPSRGRA